MIEDYRCAICGEPRVWHSMDNEYCPVIKAGILTRFTKKKFKSRMLYEAADLKAAKLETVKQVVQIVARVQYFPGADIWDEFVREIDKLKEEINAS